ncbi:hypothetical protein SprV_0502003100 [Sparganum proliferum]
MIGRSETTVSEQMADCLLLSSNQGTPRIQHERSLRAEEEEREEKEWEDSECGGGRSRDLNFADSLYFKTALEAADYSPASLETSLWSYSSLVVGAAGKINGEDFAA